MYFFPLTNFVLTIHHFIPWCTLSYAIILNSHLLFIYIFVLISSSWFTIRPHTLYHLLLFIFLIFFLFIYIFVLISSSWFTIRPHAPCIKTDYCHAFVAYFECAFTQIHKPIIFSTAPQGTPRYVYQYTPIRIQHISTTFFLPFLNCYLHNPPHHPLSNLSSSLFSSFSCYSSWHSLPHRTAPQPNPPIGSKPCSIYRNLSQVL